MLLFPLLLPFSSALQLMLWRACEEGRSSGWDRRFEARFNDRLYESRI